MSPGTRVGLRPWLDREGTVEGVESFYVLVAWDDGLGPYRVRPEALAPAGSASDPEERFVCAAPRGRSTARTTTAPRGKENDDE